MLIDKDVIKALHSLYIKLLDAKYELKITQKEFLALNKVHTIITRQQSEIERLKKENNVAPVMRGEWEYVGMDKMGNVFRCSNCAGRIGLDKETDYCPNCGAKMDLEVGE